MADDFIRRNALREARNLAIRAYENVNVLNADAIRKSLKPLLDAVVDTPAADVAEVVHGRWIEEWDLYDKGFYISRKVWAKCSCCGMKTAWKDESSERKVDYNFCPNCGAKMNGGEADNG